MAKQCRACDGPLCPYCGGCITEGECGCFSDSKAQLLKALEDITHAYIREVQARAYHHYNVENDPIVKNARAAIEAASALEESDDQT